MRFLMMAITIFHIGCTQPPKAGVSLVVGDSDLKNSPYTNNSTSFAVPHTGNYELHRLDSDGKAEPGPPLERFELHAGDRISFGYDEKEGFCTKAPIVIALPQGKYVWMLAQDSELTGPRLRQYKLRKAGREVADATVLLLVVVAVVGVYVLYNIAPRSSGYGN